MIDIEKTMGEISLGIPDNNFNTSVRQLIHRGSEVSGEASNYSVLNIFNLSKIVLHCMLCCLAFWLHNKITTTSQINELNIFRIKILLCFYSVITMYVGKKKIDSPKLQYCVSCVCLELHCSLKL